MSAVRTSLGEASPLSDFLCFSIYSANLAFSRVYKPVLEALGLVELEHNPRNNRVRAR